MGTPWVGLGLSGMGEVDGAGCKDRAPATQKKEGASGGHRPWAGRRALVMSGHQQGGRGTTLSRLHLGLGGFWNFRLIIAIHLLFVPCPFRQDRVIVLGHSEWPFLMVTYYLTLLGQRSPLFWGHAQKSGENACVTFVRELPASVFFFLFNLWS